jgi:predicted ATPase/class 3 adenylate cyclase
MDAYASFGAWIQRRRKALDLTQAELAERVGCALGTIRKIETDERRPSRQIAARLADQLRLAPEQRAAFLKAARAEVAVDRLAPPTQLVPPTVDATKLPRGTVTFLFSDIEGSTQLWEQHLQGMPGALARHQAILHTSIQVHNGVVFKTVGDGVCAAFARAPDALSAALAAQRALHTAAWGSTGPLRVRMALHTGLAEERDADYFGSPLNRLARLLACGHGGQVLLSLATEELVREHLPPNVALRDLGAHRLRDLSLAEQIFQLVAPDLPTDFPPLRTLSAYRTNLPVQPTALLGREQEVAAVRDLLRQADVRLVTLSGPGGVGKTRLALQVAAELLDDNSPPLLPQREGGPGGEGRFGDGIYFVNLAPISDPALVAATIAHTLEVRETAGQPLLETLKAHLRDKRLLLLLDNFEQVLQAAPDIAALLAAAPGLKLLVTSRAVLHLRGEKEITVPPLALPLLPLLPRSRARERGPGGEGLTQYAAVALFIERALDVQPNFTVTNENAPAVAEICYRLDGLPLAIELAAARIKLFRPEALLKRLEHRFTVLTGGSRDLPARQQTLRSTIDWSYHLLPPEIQTLFRRLAVFVGGCTLEAAEAICGTGERENGRAGERLADSPLLPFSPSPLLVLDGLAALVDQSLLRQAEGPDGEPRFRRLETIREYALERLEQSGEADAMRRQHAQFFLRWAEEAEPQLIGRSQQLWLARLETDHDNLRAALTWAVAGGSAEVTVRLATALGGFWLTRGYMSEGRRWLEAALEQSSALPASAQAKALAAAGHMVLFGQGDDVRATALYEASLTLWRELGRQEEIAWTLYYLGRVAFLQSDYAQATTLLTESLALFRAQDDQQGIAWTLNRLGAMANDQGDYPRAKTLLEGSLARLRELGDKGGTADILHNLSTNARLQGDDARALALEQESLALCRELGLKSLIPSVLIGLGYIVQRQGDAPRAGRCFAEALALCRELGDQRPALCLAGLAGVAAMQGQPERAARLFGAAEALAELLHARPTAVHQIELERNVALARAQLDEATFAGAWEAGRALSLEQAIAEATAEEAQAADA